jgi:hypothetical protein
MQCSLTLWYSSFTQWSGGRECVREFGELSNKRESAKRKGLKERGELGAASWGRRLREVNQYAIMSYGERGKGKQ